MQKKLYKMQNRIISYHTSAIVFILVLLITFILGFSKRTKAQESWDLTKCVNYAIDNNIALQSAYNQVENQEINVLESKANVLPDLNAGSNVYFNFGRSIDANNDITFNQTTRNVVWVESSLDIFQGLVKYNSMAYNKYLLAAQQEEAEKIYNQLIFDVTASYYEVLYSKGIEQVALNQVSVAHDQFRKMKKMVEVGKESPINAQELKSQWASDKLSLTQAQTQTSKAILKLKQQLRLDAKTTFKIDTISVNSLVINPIPSIDTLFTMAIKRMPDIQKEELLLKATEKDLAVAKGYISPRLYLSAGVGSDYYNIDSTAYMAQLTNNQNQYVNAGIVIPIFNRASTYSRIKRKQIAVENQQLQLESKREALYTEIWNLVNDLEAAEREYAASQELYAFSKLSFENVKKKLEKGLAEPTEYEVSKQRLASAEAGLLKAKLIYIMRNQMLEFYKTGNWSHVLS